MRHFLLFMVFFGSFSANIAQNYPKNYFRSPVDNPITLAGTFGELRSYHFHMGIDIIASQGTPLRAAADGYLFRVKFSEAGYGHVMYLNHPNGYTTVYAHCSRFTDTLERFLRAEQYKSECEEIDLCLPDSAFVFKKGDIIGYSGNTGHSAGPHLHFEIRDTKSEEAINPLLFGIKVKDKVKPDIQGIKIYPMNDNSSVDGKAEGKYYSLKAGKSAIFKNTITVKAYGEIAFAVQAHDHMSESSNRCGIYEIFVYNNKKEKLFGQRISRVGFDVSRYINTYKDYSEFHDHSRHLHKTYIKGNNKLNLYTEKDKTGIIKIEGSDTLNFYIKAFDLAGNHDSVCVRVIPNKVVVNKAKKTECKSQIEWAKPFEYNATGIEIDVPQGSLFNNACFHYYSKNRTAKTYSRIHAFYTDEHEPMAESFNIMIEPDTLIDSTIMNKVFIARTTDFKSITPYKSVFINGKFAAQAKSFGTFCLVADTVGPKIKPLGFIDSMQVIKSGVKEIAFEIKDDVSGLKSYKMFINNKWVLAHFDLKKQKLLLLRKEIDLPNGYYPIKVQATDEVDNITVFEKTINWNCH
jgi:hypothetical protein